MNELVPIEFKNKRILTTEQLAEIYEAPIDNIKVNFNNHKNNFEEGKHYFYLEGDDLKEFKRHVNNIYPPLINKFTSSLYLWTERGANRHCKILDTDKAWEQFDNLEENYFNVKEGNQLSPMEILDLQYQALREQGKKINSIEGRVETLSLTMNISAGQAQTIQKLVHKRVKTLCYGDESNAYNNQKLRKKVYQYIWKTLKDYLNVTVYHNILRKDYAIAIRYIETITLQGALLREVQEANSQILINV
ncbi:toxin Bro (plasmid) [Clostridium carboxidivorans P7]|uniref:Phage protein n=2 Tax=Clostridium TaxID=1485 RepID=C6PZX8_9CLOT|nr:ORF6C domain-containing protein [Clostridium carboxidivorans]ADO12130.1 phage protein [Clostridium carboxidivorans P7]AKN34265.1 toxin Bro [Clostridium carboxidivorans P7]EET85188.1 conserved hypothetical protein [Clostridium carboxidivorans P7]EFG87536.1 toxin-antitoxin system, toxin component, Bro family [Clostridium carboxidivorans P7]